MQAKQERQSINNGMVLNQGFEAMLPLLLTGNGQRAEPYPTTKQRSRVTLRAKHRTPGSTPAKTAVRRYPPVQWASPDRQLITALIAGIYKL